MHEAVAGTCANGLSPAQVATAAFDAIEKISFGYSRKTNSNRCWNYALRQF